jgi:hypothetical protein
MKIIKSLLLIKQKNRKEKSTKKNRKNGQVIYAFVSPFCQKQDKTLLFIDM